MTEAPFAVQASEPMIFRMRGRLTTMYLLSPYVWRDEGGCGYHLLVRAVPRRDDVPCLKISEIWYGHSMDGLSFVMDEGPVVFPNPDGVDRDGCEDPTVLVHDGHIHVWYSGWHQARETGRLLRAEGRDVHTLEKRGIVIDSSGSVQNPKEAAIAHLDGAGWRLLHEYAHEKASRVAVLTGDGPEGPWQPTDLSIPPRDGRWDDWHLSTGPIVRCGTDRPVMFYNGATRDACWGIGWIAFDRDMTRVTGRGEDPIIAAPETDDQSRDIAFAASAIEGETTTWLYYTIADKTPMRAILASG